MGPEKDELGHFKVTWTMSDIFDNAYNLNITRVILEKFIDHIEVNCSIEVGVNVSMLIDSFIKKHKNED
jgi:hypothetical protein